MITILFNFLFYHHVGQENCPSKTFGPKERVRGSHFCVSVGGAYFFGRMFFCKCAFTVNSRHP